MVEFGGTENLFDVLMQYINFRYFRFIADLYNSVEVWVAYTQYTISHEYYAFAGRCNSCQLKEQCSKAKSGSTLKRHLRHDDLDSMLQQPAARNIEKI